ncbi:MAG: HYR domain-containing protein [Saprospiraceae bacterium]
MSNKLKHSTLSKGWGLTSVRQYIGNEQGQLTFSLTRQRIGQMSGFIIALLITTFFATPVIAQCTLTCDDQKQISLGTNGYAVIIPELILNGDHSCAGTITVKLYDENNQEIGDTVRCEHINRTFQVSVSSSVTGGDCWSTITVEDKLAPRIFFSFILLQCAASTLPADLGYPTIIDNCEIVDSTDLRYFDLYKELACGTTHNGMAVGGRITRSWTAIDNNGNVGTCTQSIYLLKENVNNVTFPVDRDDNSGPAISCTNGAIDDPTMTGEPMINGHPVRSGDACKLFISYQDQYVDVCPPASYRVIRRWEVTDLCTEEVRVGIQSLFVVDRDPPVITCPDSFAVTANLSTCGATVILPQATATDSCSDFTVQPSWEFGKGYGPFSNVPVGVHTVTYTAIDKCGNSSACTTKVTILDASRPIAICRDELHIALTNDGFAEVNAVVFDGGSRDNCEVVKWEVARVADGVFGDSLRFTCVDVGTPVSIQLRVYDAAGLSGMCGTTVIITDEIRPVITDCPANISLDCTQDYEDTYLTGYLKATDECGIREIYFEDEADVNSCNIGMVTRTWFAVDSAGNFSTCQQLIFLEDKTPIQVTFPADYTTNECGADLRPVATGEPIVEGSDCESILMTYDDEVFLIGDSACLKILRTWTVLDWCSYDPADSSTSARIVSVQLIKVLDENAPVITACPVDTMVVITDFACETSVILPDLIATDCNPNLTITNTSIYADVNGRNASGMYPIGTHKVRFVVSDGCSNISTCEMTITVEDRHAPTPVCRYGLAIPLMAGGFVTVPPNAINSGSYDNCSGEEGLIYEISPNYFTCEDVGRQTINLIVTDQAGNTQFCETDIFIQDNSGVCTGTAPRTAIGGRIFTEDGTGMQQIPIQISGGLEQMGYTDDEGNYLFDDLSSQSTYTVRPMPNEEYGGGLSTFDLVLIRKHILGVTPLSSPYKILAADVNNSKSISAFDMVIIRQVVLGTRTNFPENTSWRYIDASYDFPDPRNPFMEVVPEFRDYKQLLINDLSRDFVGFKVGDVNNSASPRAKEGEGRSPKGTLLLTVADLEMKAGFDYSIPFKAKDLQEIQGYQFTINFNTESLRLKEVVSGEPNTMGLNNFGLAHRERGKVTTSWENAGAVQTNAETVLFTLVFEAQEATNLSEVVDINSSITLAEAYNSEDELLNVGMQFTNQPTTKNLRLYQNRPNPFRNQTIISFNLPTSTEGSISIYDINGKLLKSYYGKYAQGHNEVMVNLSDIHTQTGVLYYHLTTPVTKRLSQKMVIIRE